MAEKPWRSLRKTIARLQLSVTTGRRQQVHAKEQAAEGFYAALREDTLVRLWPGAGSLPAAMISARGNSARLAPEEHTKQQLGVGQQKGPAAEKVRQKRSTHAVRLLCTFPPKALRQSESEAVKEEEPCTQNRPS